MPIAKIRGIDLAYDDVGVGMPVVLLHGFPFNRAMWRDQAAFLGERFRVITPDLRGFGESSRGTGPITMEEIARDILALLDHLKLQRVVLGGLSMGGYAALSFYRKFDLRVRSMLLFDTRAQADTEEAKQGREALAQQAETEGIAPVVEAFLPKLLAPATFADHPEVVDRLRAIMESTPPETAAAALRGMALRPDSLHLLDRVMAPTLLVVGSEDGITPVADANKMKRGIMGAKLHVIEGAGHVSNFDAPDEFNQTVWDFLTSR